MVNSNLILMYNIENIVIATYLTYLFKQERTYNSFANFK